MGSTAEKSRGLSPHIIRAIGRNSYRETQPRFYTRKEFLSLAGIVAVVAGILEARNRFVSRYFQGVESLLAKGSSRWVNLSSVNPR